MNRLTLTPSSNHFQHLSDILLNCGNAHSPETFAIKVIDHLSEICHFDQALVYYLDANKNVSGQYLKNISDYWSNVYISYYAYNKKYKYNFINDIREDPSCIRPHTINWEAESSPDFIPNYIKARGLKWSCGFALYDLNGAYRTIFSLDRTQSKAFSQKELSMISELIPHLNNLHKNFFYQDTHRFKLEKLEAGTHALTARETEIVNLLCQGISPNDISRSLYIAPTTTYKHLAHIYSFTLYDVKAHEPWRLFYLSEDDLTISSHIID